MDRTDYGTLLQTCKHIAAQGKFHPDLKIMVFHLHYMNNIRPKVSFDNSWWKIMLQNIRSLAVGPLQINHHKFVCHYEVWEGFPAFEDDSFLSEKFTVNTWTWHSTKTHVYTSRPRVYFSSPVGMNPERHKAVWQYFPVASLFKYPINKKKSAKHYLGFPQAWGRNCRSHQHQRICGIKGLTLWVQKTLAAACPSVNFIKFISPLSFILVEIDSRKGDDTSGHLSKET